MARINKPVQNNLKTHEGAPARIINPELQLRRSVMACLLWENTFYEEGQDIADRIKTLVHANEPLFVASLAIEARTKMKLRHVPLLLVRELARHKKAKDHKSLVRDTLAAVIQRADELTEFVAIYWKDGREKLSAAVKKGLALAFVKFSEYDLAKYNRDDAVKLRDVLFLCHAKPKNPEQEIIFKRLVDGQLAIPDTWETNLSAGKNKKETWERLLSENKLGAMALLRNLRNMKDENVNEQAIFSGLENMKVERVLPYRFVTAARYAPQWEPQLETAMLKCLSTQEKLKGKTVILIDVSGSMEDKMSGKSEATRIDTACGLAILLREICEGIEVYTFSSGLAIIPPRRGFALRDAINSSQPHASTYLGEAIKGVDARSQYDRLIVITDEQSHDSVPNSKGKGYMINVDSNKNGVGYGPWIHIDGFSEAVISYIQVLEESQTVQQ